MKSQWYDQSDFSDDQLERRCAAYRCRQYRRERAWRQHWPWALAASIIGAWGMVFFVIYIIQSLVS